MSKRNNWTKEKTIEEARKYTSVSEFSKNAKGAYAAAQRNGWMDEMTWFSSCRHAPWTLSAAKAEASKYETLHDFIKGSPGAYQASMRNGWLVEMTWLANDHRKWNRDSVIEESRKYRSRTEFAKACMGAYLYAKKHSMLDEMTWLPLKVRTPWAKEECIEESKKYTTRKDFSIGSSGAYTAAIENGWIHEMNWLKLLHHSAWTLEECIEEGKKYTSRSEFQKKSSGAYQSAFKNGWLDKMDWLTTPVYGPLKQLSNHIVYVYIDEANQACYVGRTNRLKKRDREHRHPYNPSKPDSLKRYFDSLGIEMPQPIVLKDKLLPSDSQFWEDYYLNYYKGKGYTIINRGKTGVNIGSLGGGFIKWDKETTMQESKKYRTPSEFQLGSPSAYQAAKRYKWIKEYSWLEYDQMPNGYWSKERVIEESKKYTSRREMEQGSPAAYSAALKNGWSADLPLEYKYVEKGYYTKEKIQELASLCQKKVEFKRKYSRAYVIARENGWLNELFPLLRPDRNQLEFVFEEEKI